MIQPIHPSGVDSPRNRITTSEEKVLCAFNQGKVIVGVEEMQESFKCRYSNEIWQFQLQV